MNNIKSLATLLTCLFLAGTAIAMNYNDEHTSKKPRREQTGSLQVLDKLAADSRMHDNTQSQDLKRYLSADNTTPDLLPPLVISTQELQEWNDGSRQLSSTTSDQPMADTTNTTNKVTPPSMPDTVELNQLLSKQRPSNKTKWERYCKEFTLVRTTSGQQMLAVVPKKHSNNHNQYFPANSSTIPMTVLGVAKFRKKGRSGQSRVFTEEETRRIQKQLAETNIAELTKNPNPLQLYYIGKGLREAYKRQQGAQNQQEQPQ